MVKDWSPAVVTLCEKFLAESNDDAEKASAAMFEYLSFNARYDHVLREAVRDAVRDCQQRRRR